MRTFVVMKQARKINSTQRWLSGIPYEVAFWRSYYGNRHSRNNLLGWSLYGKSCILDSFDVDAFMAEQQGDDAQILDVGCALSYAFGNIINGKEANVSYVDPLAPFYNDILDRYNIDRPRIKYGMVESLSASFAPDSITLVHIRNALDHCANPIDGIIQALAILKIGGVLYLNHFRNEAQNEGYRGFHQFNITEEHGDLLLWNKDTKINVTERLRGIATVKTTVTDARRIVAIIVKDNALPSNLYALSDTAQAQAQMLMDTVRYFHCFRVSLKYQWLRLYTTMGHRIMRLTPNTLMRKIKHLLSTPSGNGKR